MFMLFLGDGWFATGENLGVDNGHTASASSKFLVVDTKPKNVFPVHYGLNFINLGKDPL